MPSFAFSIRSLPFRSRWWPGIVPLSLGLSLGILCHSPFALSQTPPLPLRSVPVEQLRGDLGQDDRLWAKAGQPGDRAALVRSIDQSLTYLRSPQAVTAYQQYPIPGVTLDRVRRSLLRFRQILLSTRSPEELQVAVRREFDFYQSIGKDNQGTVAFTGYFEPVYRASRRPTAEYRYPLYRLPPDWSQWSKPHPSRLELEGADGLQGSKGKLRGLELVWLRDRLEAFLVHVQGSARLQLTDGQTMTVGYAGKTDHPYSGIGRELVKDGKMILEGLTLPKVLEYFRQHPAQMNTYLPRNQSFVFFRETYGAAATGSLRVPVTAGRSIATDKSLMPPGALALIACPLPIRNALGQWQTTPVNRYVLDQDTGSAIKGAGRVDLFTGTGMQAGEQAGLINGTGELYYLLLKQ